MKLGPAEVAEMQQPSCSAANLGAVCGFSPSGLATHPRDRLRRTIVLAGTPSPLEPRIAVIRLSSPSAQTKKYFAAASHSTAMIYSFSTPQE